MTSGFRGSPPLRRRLRLPLLAAACSSPIRCSTRSRSSRGRCCRPVRKVVQLRDIGLASYLDRREIVRSSEGYRLDVRSNDWWGQPLGGMLARALVVGLSQRLPGTTSMRERRHLDGPQRCPGDQHPTSRCRQRGHLILLAQAPSTSTGHGDRRRAPSRSPSRCRAATTRATWSRSAMPWANSPTASPRCCSGERLHAGPPTVIRGRRMKLAQTPVHW